MSPGGTTSAPGAGGSGSGAETKSPNSSSSEDSSSAAACDAGSGAGSGAWPAAARTTWAALAASLSEVCADVGNQSVTRMVCRGRHNTQSNGKFKDGAVSYTRLRTKANLSATVSLPS